MKIVIEDGRQNFYQWDKEQRVKLEGVTLNHYVHFGRPDGGAYEVKIYKDGSWFYAKVPNIWLQLSGIQKLYIVNGDKQTEHRASLFITPREKPDGYLYTETEILSFVSLDERLRRLEGDPSVGGYATEQYVKDYAQPKGDYLESSALPAAIDTALAQAKESGAFDGAPGPAGPAGPQGEPGQPGEPGKDGQDGKDYVLTDDDLTEIAEQAAGLVEIPDSGGNVELYIGPDKPTNGALYWLDTSEDEVAVVLTGISAVYSGGDVTVGTAVTDLTGIVVTATYSDGSTETVTDYTLSGTIAEGSNTVTVTYQNMTATFTVTGVAESGGEEDPEPVTYTITNNLTNVTSNNSTTSAEENASCTATLTAASGYELDTVSVTMGGTDVTSTVYADGVVTISAVTGNVVITATATATSTESNVYTLQEIAMEVTEGQAANGAPNAKYIRYKVEDIKTGDIVRLASYNAAGDAGLYDGTNYYLFTDTSKFTKKFMDGYGWCQYTWIADTDYEWCYFASNTETIAKYPNAVATIEKAVN